MDLDNAENYFPVDLSESGSTKFKRHVNDYRSGIIAGKSDLVM